jgi:phosphoenolpyruvate synthase/pyruvate phosphate dikinase
MITQVRKEVLQGTPASPGSAVGPARVITKPEGLGELEGGEVLVIPVAHPLFTPGIFKAAAIIAKNGGFLCALATISRELGIPCIVGLNRASSVFRDGMWVIVDGDKGTVTL